MNDLRVAALNQAAQDEKHFGGSVAHYVGPPNPAAVVNRAEAYLKFLFGETSKPAPAPAKKRRT